MAPVGLYSRLKAYYTGETEPEVPAISTTAAIALLILYTAIYVAPFYLSATTRPSPQLSRDAPSVIRGRIRSVTLSCFICSLTTFLLLSGVDHGSAVKAFHHMGYFPIGLKETAQSLALTSVLFLGPLFLSGIAEGGWRDWICFRGLTMAVSSWIGYRNYVAGPVTEEVLFRSCAVPLLLLAQTSKTTIVFLTPIVFGLAHVHHFYEFRISHPHTPISSAVLRSLFQLSYTTVFGGYATFLYMRTGSLLSVILVHAFCNWMGPPKVWGRVDAREALTVSDVRERKKREDTGHQSSEHLGVSWTIAYYILLITGAVAWYKLLWTWTKSGAALVEF